MASQETLSSASRLRDDFTRFVILTTGRSGSNLIVSAINEHPMVLAYSELLNPSELDRKRTGATESGRYYRTGEDAATFLEEAVYDAAYPERIKAVGFKLLFDQAGDSFEERAAWRYLVDRKDIAVLHVVRPNLLEALVSYSVARMTGEWFREEGQPPPGQDVAPFEISPLECSWFFRRATLFNRWVVRTFTGRPFLSVSFDELTGQFEPTMNRVFDFLDVAPIAVAPKLQKQSTRSAKEMLANYDELKSHFQSTQFRWFF